MQERERKEEDPKTPWMHLTGRSKHTDRADISLLLIIPGSLKTDYQSRKTILIKPDDLEYATLKYFIPQKEGLFFNVFVYQTEDALELKFTYGKKADKHSFSITTQKSRSLYSKLLDLKERASLIKPNNKRMRGSEGEMLPAADIPAKGTFPISRPAHIVQGGAPESNRRAH